ncbi:hypothetical protein EMIHUDRAFT_60912 [Emiliania huxleyi CCMP1516]|uniref:Amidohydrolase-related domain-containing protein n=2 Tax=Emiliania huxleyi TaxID=2903 RepID=A0A0D3L1S5_EMIH1|nr:hypothetical protein EMIHUDRAFT_60912 [Emiliania huxleyi CCMP1516]EOD41960.1 hypothetical protein EMIHUDRAFT_60912 [Emiliania huxleyi CCMP1516]|eukprot:XP_005794389.1 hypothetical protein EMIHUDRAFT_60912 [Emiliania huxleyi CCMP1516]
MALSPPAGTYAVLGHIVDAPQLDVVRGLDEPSLVVVSGSGEIESVHRAGAADAAASLEASGVTVIRLGQRDFLVPGFIDCHVHASQWAYMGTGIDRPLMADDGFLAKYAFPAESALNAQTAGEVYRAAIDDMLRNGTTTALVWGSARLDASEEYVKAVVERGGPRSLIGKVSMDRHCPEGYVETTAQSLADTEAFVLRTKAANDALGLPAGSPPLVAPAITPRFLPTCTAELLRGLGALAEKHDCFVQSHLSESCDELAFSSSLFPGFRSDAAAFAAFGLLRRPSLMAHCVHLQPGEAELLLQHGCAMAHCPTSNFFFAKEALPVRQMLQLGVKVGLGTDVAGGYSPAMLVSLRHAVLASKTLQFRRAKGCATLRDRHNLSHTDGLHLATQAGADALGFGGSLGSFDAGKRFDAVVWAAEGPNVRCYRGGVAEEPSDLLHKLLTNGDDRNIKAVYIGGRRVV